MDLGTLLGLALGVAMILMGILTGGASLLIYWNIPSVFITIGGSFAALMVSNPLNRVLGVFKYVSLVTRVPNFEEERVIANLVTFSEKARREGLLALEDDLEEVEEDFMRKGIQLVVDGTDPEIIKSILYTELNQLQERHQDGIMIFDQWGKLAPAFGMLGTLIGLIAMLANLNDQNAIGQGMSTALITTLYGAILANLVFIPLKSKLEVRDKYETLVREIMIEGILSIQSGDNPRILEEKLLSFLPPARRDAVRQESVRE
ncbi:MAG TPA: motility protein A [Spirochaetia bacterium]|nr:motility protein A [Spirochaetia bacterium]